MSRPLPDDPDETDAPGEPGAAPSGASSGEPIDEAGEAPAPRGPFTRESPLTFIVPEPLLLRIERVDKPGAAPGDQPVAFTRAGPKEVLLAVNAYPNRLVDAFFASDAFGEPVIVVGAAWEEEGGIRGELSALLPERTMRAIQDTVVDDDEDDEDELDDDDDAEPHFPLVIGAVLRFPENRRFPNDFELEVDDLMRSILEGRAMDAAEKRIDNLLGGI